MARPVAKDMTTPNANSDEKGVVIAGGETGIIENALKMASSIHAAV